MERRWLKVREAAQYLGMNPKTLYDLIAKGEIVHSRPRIKGVRIGIRLDVKKLDEILENAEIQTLDELLR